MSGTQWAILARVLQRLAAWRIKFARRRLADRAAECVVFALLFACLSGCASLDPFWAKLGDKIPSIEGREKTGPIAGEIQPEVKEPTPEPEPPAPTPEPTEAITITSWGKEPASGATLDTSAVLSVSPDGVKWRWTQDPKWKGYKLGSGREIIAVCYVAVPDGRGGWKAGKFDHWPKNLVNRNRHNIEGGYSHLPVPSRGDTVYWFAVSGDKRRRTNFVKGRW